MARWPAWAFLQHRQAHLSLFLNWHRLHLPYLNITMLQWSPTPDIAQSLAARRPPYSRHIYKQKWKRALFFINNVSHGCLQLAISTSPHQYHQVIHLLTKYTVTRYFKHLIFPTQFEGQSQDPIIQICIVFKLTWSYMERGCWYCYVVYQLAGWARAGFSSDYLFFNCDRAWNV